jgi:hypothetical protein
MEPLPSNAGFFFEAHRQVEDRCMRFDHSKSGDRLETTPEKPSVVVANIPERQGVTGHNVRYVLFFGLSTVIIAFGLLLVSFLR